MNDTNINASAHQHPSTFLPCDWGTSSFRLCLAMGEGSVKEVVGNSNGIAATFKGWREDSGSEAWRFDYYLEVIRAAIAGMEGKVGNELHGLPLVISG